MKDPKSANDNDNDNDNDGLGSGAVLLVPPETGQVPGTYMERIVVIGGSVAWLLVLNVELPTSMVWRFEGDVDALGITSWLLSSWGFGWQFKFAKQTNGW